MDAIARRLAVSDWGYGAQDDAAFEEIAHRVAETGKKRSLITYSDLVNGIEFNLDNVAGGHPYQISVGEWTSLDRAIAGNFLGRLCAESYERGKVTAQPKNWRSCWR